MRYALSIAVLAATACSAFAQRGADSLGISTTHQRITVRGRELRYTARAGYIPIRDNETGSVHGRIFFIAYTLDGAARSARRPVTFAWNGGPGSSSSLVHLLGFGPKRIDAKGAVVTNQDTWLTATDLVFVDPIGTGYSRPERAEYGAEFYSNRGDAESVAEFIRVYLQRNAAWDAPIFLAGESFGVSRAARVAEVLERHRTPVSGVVLMGLGLPIGTLPTAMQTALAVPTYAAAAYYHGLLAAPDAAVGTAWQKRDQVLRSARVWAINEYAPALARLDSLTPAQRAVVRAELARYTGLAVDRIDAKTLVVPLEQFAVQLLRSKGEVIGRYDTRLTGPIDTTEKEFDPTRDPSLVNIIDDHAVARYMREDLRYESDLRYQGPFGGGYPPPKSFRGDWMSVKWHWQPPVDSTLPVDTMPPLERAMRTDPRLRVMLVCGYYDLMCDVAANAYAAAALDSTLAKRVVARSLFAGHAVYTDSTARRELADDAAVFIRSTPSP